MSENVTCPAPDCQLPVDLTIRSSDGVLIGAHKANLDQYSEGFPSVDVIAPANPHGDTVDLAESAETLKLLLRFMHKFAYPDTARLPEAELFALAAAAEKYMVHAAMALCHNTILFRIKESPIAALGYGVQFGYDKIVEEAAPLVRAYKSETMRDGLQDPVAFCAWLNYKMASLERMHDFLFRTKRYNRLAGFESESSACPRWMAFNDKLMLKLHHHNEDFLRAAFDGTVSRVAMETWHNTSGCQRWGRCFCASRYDEFQRDLKATMADSPMFRSFLSPSSTKVPETS